MEGYSMEMLSPARIARTLGVCESTVYAWIRNGTLPPPTLRLGTARGYTPEEAEEIREWYADRSQPQRTAAIDETSAPHTSGAAFDK